MIRPCPPDLKQWTKLHNFTGIHETADFSISFDLNTGALTSLLQKTSGKDWASPVNPLGWLRYQTFSAADYERFFRQYILLSQQNNGWSREDFTKPGLELATPLSRFWQPHITASYQHQNVNSTRFLFLLSAEPQSVTDYGCPQDFVLEYSFAAGSQSVQIDLQWFHKPATRLPEAVWFSFAPDTTAAGDWYIEKLGAEISPLEVVEFGNRHLHASGKYVRWHHEGHQLKINSLDAPLVAPGQPSLLDFNNNQPDLKQGMHFNLLNNLWGTNFPMWFEEDCRFRFKLDFE